MWMKLEWMKKCLLLTARNISFPSFYWNKLLKSYKPHLSRKIIIYKSDSAYDKRKSNYISWKQIFIQFQLYNCRNVSWKILWRSKTIFCFMLWMQFKKNYVSALYVLAPGAQLCVLCIGWQADIVRAILITKGQYK